MCIRSSYLTLFAVVAFCISSAAQNRDSSSDGQSVRDPAVLTEKTYLAQEMLLELAPLPGSYGHYKNESATIRDPKNHPKPAVREAIRDPLATTQKSPVRIDRNIEQVAMYVADESETAAPLTAPPQINQHHMEGAACTHACTCNRCRTRGCSCTCKRCRILGCHLRYRADKRAARKLAKKCCLQNSHWGFPEEFCEAPFGSSVDYYAGAQLTNGLASQMKLYHYDFFGADDPQAGNLTARGYYQVLKIARLLEQHPGPIVVQRTVSEPELDEARRQAVLNAIIDLGYPIEAEQVVANYDVKPGISGVEELLIYQNLLKQTEAQGISTGSAIESELR